MTSPVPMFDTPNDRDHKTFHDPIHKDMEIHPLCVAIIDTPEFQRLRGLKQTGLVYLVYPGATNCRFQHCVGVCHLAGRFVTRLMQRQPELGISERDVLCVSVAGLCHDLGHGPFSHLWERFLMARYKTNRVWTHEKNSVRILRHMLKNNNLVEQFVRYFGDDYKYYVGLIEQQVAGTKETRLNNSWITPNGNGIKYDKSFLYEIVANHESGIDVDKWDYMRRDCHFTGIPPSFDHEHLMMSARVIPAEDGVRHICYRDKEWVGVDQMFRTRALLHRVVYQHKVVKVLDVMLIEALIEADQFLTFSSNGREKCLSEVGEEVELFLLTNDCIYQSILLSSDPQLARAREILKKIERRQLYVFVSQAMIESSIANDFQQNRANYSSQILAGLPQQFGDDPLTANDIILEILTLDYGMKDKNPLDEAYSYSKEQPNVAKKRKISNYSRMLCNFEDKYVMCFCRRKSAAVAVRHSFVVWCHQNGLRPVDDDNQTLELCNGS